MKDALPRFYAFLDRPLAAWARVVLAALAVPLVLGVFAPLWQIQMTAAQYPQGLTLKIYSHKIEGGHDGSDLQEINTLNHYIGMRKISRAELSDLDWIPFALGALVLLTLRVAAIGNVRALIDLVVLATYVFGFSMARFVYKLYTFGHELSHEAPVRVQPFTPAILGSKQIANFTTVSLPDWGTVYASVFGLGLVGITAWHLWSGRREAMRDAALPSHPGAAAVPARAA